MPPVRTTATPGRPETAPRVTSPRRSDQSSVRRPEDTLETLRNENLRLRRELKALSREAGKNEVIFWRFHSLELSLLDATSLPELVDRIIHETREMLGLDEVTLILDDPGHEIRNLLAGNGLALPLPPLVQWRDGPTTGKPAPGRPKGPWLGPYHEEHSRLFSGRSRLGSVALLPLMAQGCLFGRLNLASADAARYTRRHAVDFHCRLASVASLCLQNAVNRERLVVDGHTDPLTRWRNRRYLDLRLPQEVARAIRYGEPLSCLILDVDRFKQVNDRYGHAAGDCVLREVAERVRNELRNSDLAVRYGGEEFVVFLIRTTERDASDVAERIRQCVAATPLRVPGDQLLDITVSGGTAELVHGDGQEDPAALGAAMLHRADTALYRAKAQGRNRIVSYSLLAGSRIDLGVC